MSQADILALFEEWNEALKTGNPEAVAALYEDNAILLPTLSNNVRHDKDERVDYFTQFLALKAQGVIDESNIRIMGDIAINSGIYTFTFKDNSTAQARFTFVYRWDGTRWKIIEHHSSKMPED